jgi:hypothetical protein
MVYRIEFDSENNCFWNKTPATITENETCYIIKDKFSGLELAFIEYADLVGKCKLLILDPENNNNNTTCDNLKHMFFDKIIRMALASDKDANVPTACLLDLDSNSHFIPSTKTSLKRLANWNKFISRLCLSDANVVIENLPSFMPEEKIYMGNLLNMLNLNVERLNAEDKECITSSAAIFDFYTNLERITWWNLVKDKHQIDISNYESYTPAECVFQLNRIMRIVCVWEAPYVNLKEFLSCCIIFMYYVHDLNLGINEYTTALPILQFLASIRHKLTAEPTTAEYSESYITYARNKYDQAIRTKNRTSHTLHLKVAQLEMRPGDMIDLAHFIVEHMSEIICDCGDSFEGVLVYLKLVFFRRAKCEMMYYIAVYSTILAIIRLGKIKSIRETDEIGGIRVKNWEQLKLQTNLDVKMIFSALTPFANFLDSISKANSNFNQFCLDDETIFYYLKNSMSLNEFVDYVLRYIMPIITSYIKDII